MGMDYYGANGSDFRLSSSEHQYIGALLYQLGADLSEWAVANDGEQVSAGACKAWARVLCPAVADLPELRVPDATKKTAAFDQVIVAIRSSEAGIASSDTSPVTGLFELFEAPHDGMLEVPAEPADGPWILDFCDFLETCNGFAQW